ncbi:MAG: hypothetical protein NC347_05770 [Clostridium sp.]|nr:hypothetical protein [Clostridium sp.]
MKREKISMIIGELADRHIEDALHCEQHTLWRGWRKWQKAVACVALATFCFFSVTGIAYASNVEFRKMVVKFVSSFSEEEKEQIKNGHETTSLDKIDVLVDFLHDYNEHNWGNGVKVKYAENGFDYIVFEKNNQNVNIIVTCDTEQFKLLVNMGGEEIEGGTQAWKVASYQLLSNEEADELLKSFSKETPRATVEEENDATSGNSEDSVISAGRQHGKIYNALHKEKENIKTLTEKETQEFKSILGSYVNDETGWDGQEYNYIILFDDASYMMTVDGFVIKEEKNATSAFKMNARDLEEVVNLFERYKVE